MNLREALRNQSPSLALQRAAADEIARLDAQVARILERYVMAQCPENVDGWACSLVAGHEGPCRHGILDVVFRG